MLLNCGFGEDSAESLGQQGDSTSPSYRRPVLGVHWKDWCWSWNSNTLATSCEELTHWKRPWCWEGLGTGGEGDDRGWDDWMASPTWWTWVWANSGSWWWTGRPGVLRFMGSQRVGHNWVIELNWTEGEKVALVVKNSPAKAGDTGDEGFIPGWGRSPGEGNGNPLQYSCLEHPMDRGAWWSIVHGVAKSWTWLKWLNTHTHTHTHTQGDKRSTFDWCGIRYDGDEERGHEWCLDF